MLRNWRFHDAFLYNIFPVFVIKTIVYHLDCRADIPFISKHLPRDSQQSIARLEETENSVILPNILMPWC